MNNLLILTDFSQTANHAARYAAALTHQFRFPRIILYHAYQVIQPVSEVTPFIQDIQASAESAREELNALKNILIEIAHPQTKIDCRAEDVNLAESINKIAKEENADIIVMGITGKGKLEQALVGSNAIRIADVCFYPVLIVPPKASIVPLQRIVFACDFQRMKGTIPSMQLKRVLDEFRVPLNVVNVDYKGKGFSSDTPLSTAEWHELLDAYEPTYDYIENSDRVKGIMEFAETNKASLIILIPKTHGIFEGLFHRSTSHELIYHSYLPLLLLHEHKKE